MKPNSTDPQIQPAQPTRRRFLEIAGFAGAGAVLTGLPAVAVNASPASTDTAGLNFMLNLKYLQAAYYLAALGRLDELTAAGGDAGKVIRPASLGRGGMTIYSPFLTQYFGEIADDEVVQLNLLHTQLGRDAQPQPQLDLQTAFTGLITGGQQANFNPFEDELHFLQGAVLLEDLSTAALRGLSAQRVAAPLPELLAADARHAGMVRLMLHQQAGAAGMHLQEVLQSGLFRSQR